MILRKKSGGGGLVPLRFPGYLKKATRTFNVLRTFLLVKDIRNLQINLRNKLLYFHVFITYMRGFTPLQYLALYTKT